MSNVYISPPLSPPSNCKSTSYFAYHSSYSSSTDSLSSITSEDLAEIDTERSTTSSLFDWPETDDDSHIASRSEQEDADQSIDDEREESSVPYFGFNFSGRRFDVSSAGETAEEVGSRLDEIWENTLIEDFSHNPFESASQKFSQELQKYIQAPHLDPTFLCPIVTDKLTRLAAAPDAIFPVLRCMVADNRWIRDVPHKLGVILEEYQSLYKNREEMQTIYAGFKKRLKEYETEQKKIYGVPLESVKKTSNSSDSAEKPRGSFSVISEIISNPWISHTLVFAVSVCLIPILGIRRR